MAAYLSDTTLIYLIETNGIKNNLLTKQDADIC